LPLILATVGCQSPKPTPFAPLSARLEPVPGSAAQYFVLTNTSGQELHNFRYSAYLYSELLRRHPFVRSVPIRQFVASGSSLRAGQVMRFRPVDMEIQDPVVQPITRVQVVGHCDEGHFRQEWMNTESGELRLVGTSLR
jgi:hypothetical protein